MNFNIIFKFLTFIIFREGSEEEEDTHNQSIVLFHEDLREEDDRQQKKCILPFHEIVLPKPVAPSPVRRKKVVSFSLVLLKAEMKEDRSEVKFEA